MAKIMGLWRVSEEKADSKSVAGVSSVERALAVLTAFRHDDGPLGLAELAARTGLVKSTIMRLAVSLQRYGLVVRLPDGTYRLDAETLRLSVAYQRAFDLSDHVLPLLKRLSKGTGETASFHVLRGEAQVCLFRVESDMPVRVRMQAGEATPLDSSAIAQALRATSDGRDDAEGGLDRKVFYTGGVSDQHTACIATPVFNPDTGTPGTLAVSGPITRFTPDRAHKARQDLARAAEELARACGGVSP